MSKGQTMRYSDQELELIKRTFADNEEMLKAIRKVFLQLPLSAVERSLLLTIKSDEIQTILRKAFLPEIDGDAPFNQVVDLWLTLDLNNKEPDEAAILIKAREKLIAYLDQQLNKLSDPSSKEAIKIEKLVNGSKDTEENLVNMIARNQLVYHVEMQLNMFYLLAGTKEETVEQTKNRLQKNSNK